MIAAAAGLCLLACDGSTSKAEPDAPPVATPSQPERSETAASSLQDDAAREARYTAIATAFEADPKSATAGKKFEASRADLQAIADGGEDRFLRANAAVLLGHMFELRGDLKGAIGYWRHATKVVDDDAGPFMALAVGLAADKQFKEAATVQAKAAALDPNNLENWLALGELRIRAADQEAATAAYVDYERVRKSLIDGLTGKKSDQYLVGAPEREACARNLAVAVDTGTAFALLYSLETEPEAAVRAAVAEVMGVQRLKAYEPRLLERVKTEPDADTKTIMQWALSEIARDPVTVEQGAPADLPKDDPRAAEGKPRDVLSTAAGAGVGVPPKPPTPEPAKAPPQ